MYQNGSYPSPPELLAMDNDQWPAINYDEWIALGVIIPVVPPELNSVKDSMQSLHAEVGRLRKWNDVTTVMPEQDVIANLLASLTLASVPNGPLYMLWILRTCHDIVAVRTQK